MRRANASVGEWIDLGPGVRARVKKIIGKRILYEIDAPPGTTIEGGVVISGEAPDNRDGKTPYNALLSSAAMT